MRRLLLHTIFLAAAVPAVAQTAPATPPAATGQATPASPGVSAPGGKMFVKLRQKFAAANTTKDGRLTLAQAQAAKLKAVTQNFAAIDAARRGYITYDELAAYLMDRKADQLHAQAQALRAEDK